jgi:hypothetical protein
MGNASDEVIEKIKIHILCSVTFFRKSCRSGDKVEKCGKARQATDDNIIRPRKDAICMPDNQGKNTETYTQ